MAQSLPSKLDSMSLSSDTYYSVIAAIDFGTSSSGYAFAVREKPEQVLKSSDVTLNKWQIGMDSSFTYKAPTTVLLKPDQTFDSFGYKAEDTYGRLCDRKRHAGWWYFEKFKMALYKTKKLSRDTTLIDKERKSMPAVKVFSLVIAHLKEKLLQDIGAQTANVADNDVMYVLTVPAIWSDAAKQFMREAATSEEVGIPGDQLTLVLEPEAAAVQCRHTLACGVRRDDGSLEIQPLPVGHEYILADLGGGTADIATHKILQDDLLQEISCARGDDLGGEKFNQKFLEFLGELFSVGDMFERWKREEIGDLMRLQRAIEGLKWDVFSRPSDEIMLDVPFSLKEMLLEQGMSLESVISKSRHRRTVELFGRGKKLIISISIIKDLFKDILEGVKNHLSKIKQELPNLQTIFLVGGMAKSTYVRDFIKSTFAECRVIIPEDHGVAVLKGAVLLGNRPQTIASRIARYSYGIGVKETFRHGTHKEENKVTEDGVERCKNVFDKLIGKGKVLQYGQKFTTTTHVKAKLPETKQQSFTTYLYQSTQPSPMYTTDDGCSKLGGFDKPPPEGGWPDYCKNNVELIVGEAEFKLHLSDDLGRNYETKIDFLLPSD